MQLPRIVAQRLHGSPPPQHPDPDLLTAFAERTLPRQEREQVLGHLAHCSECRQIIALAGSEPVPENAVVRVGAWPRWLSAPLLRWGALAACVIVVATAVLIRQGKRPEHAAKVEMAMRQSAAPAAPAIAAPEEPKQLARVQPPAAKTKTYKTRPPVKSAPKDVLSANTGQTASQNPPPSVPATTSEAKQAAESVEVQSEPSGIREAGGVEADQSAQLRARNSMAKAAPAFMPRPTTETAASTIGGAAKVTDFRPPSWRLSADGLPERSFTSGQWEKVQVDHKKGFRALSSQGMEVWVGGSAGLLYHSDDVGLNWTRVIPVSGNATLSDDIVSIAFTDHLHGKVMTATGRTWVTSDAGKSWESQ